PWGAERIASEGRYALLVRTTRALLACGILGPILFITVFLVEGATRPGYSAWHNHVSLLATGEGGWMQIANFLIDGVLTIALAFGLLRVGYVLTAVFIALFGAGLLVSGVFVADPALGYPPDAAQVTTIHGVVHQGAGLATFTLIAVAAFAAAARFARERAKTWRWYSLVTGLLVVVLFV